MSISGNFPSIRPSLLLDFANVGRLDPRVTFTRASSGTYYDGVTTAKAEENLLLQSQNFTTTWANQNSTDTADTTVAPDGTTTADTITDDATNAAHYVSQNSSSISINTTYTFSCWLKAGTSNYAYLAIIDGANSQRYFTADFDLSTGTVRTSGGGTSGTLTSSSITEFPAGSGWYRCVIVGEVAAVSANTRALIGVSDGTTAIGAFGTIPYVGTGSTIIAWGAQLEQRSAVTAYTATTTQPITNYVPVLLTAQNGVPRFDHTPTTGAALGLEIEEQRTNLVTYSEDFADAAWSKTNSSITGNTVVAPDGVLTGDKLVEDTSNTSHFIGRNVTVTAASTLIYSIYAKAGERSVFNLRITDGVTGFARKFDVSNGTSDTEDVASTSAATVYGIESVGNGWYRCYVGCTMVSGTSSNIQFRLNNSGDVYTGDGYSGIFIWGAQLEAGAFATSYIPTTTTALTRSADAASMTGTNFSSWYNPAEGTLFAESVTNVPFSLFSGTIQPAIVSIDDNTLSNNRISMFYGPNSGKGVFFRIVANGVAANPGPINSSAAVEKSILAYKVGTSEGACSLNGSSVLTSSPAAIPVVTQMRIGSGTTSPRSEYIRRIAYYPMRLSNAQLQALTG